MLLTQLFSLLQEINSKDVRQIHGRHENNYPHSSPNPTISHLVSEADFPSLSLETQEFLRDTGIYPSMHRETEARGRGTENPG